MITVLKLDLFNNSKVLINSKMTRYGVIVLLLLAGLPSLAVAASFAFISNQLDNNVSVIDTASNEVVETVTVTGKPVGVAVNRQKSHVYISTPIGNGFSVLDANNFKLKRKVTTSNGALGIVSDNQGERVFVADWYENNIAVFETNDFELLQGLNPQVSY